MLFTKIISQGKAQLVTHRYSSQLMVIVTYKDNCVEKWIISLQQECRIPYSMNIL